MSWTGTSSCIPAGRLERSSCAGWSEAPVALGIDGLDGYGCCMTRHASSSGNSAGSEHVLSRGAAGARRGRFLGRPATSHGTGGSGVGGSTGSCKDSLCLLFRGLFCNQGFGNARQNQIAQDWQACLASQQAYAPNDTCNVVYPLPSPEVCNDFPVRMHW